MIRKTDQDITSMMTVGEAAQLAQYHPNHVRRLLRTGRISGAKWGQTWMINRQSWKAYMKEVGQHEKRGPKRAPASEPIEEADET